MGERRCPACNGLRVYLCAAADTPDGFFAHCGDCMARGPSQPNPKSAMASWDEPISKQEDGDG